MVVKESCFYTPNTWTNGLSVAVTSQTRATSNRAHGRHADKGPVSLLLYNYWDSQYGPTVHQVAAGAVDSLRKILRFAWRVLMTFARRPDEILYFWRFKPVSTW